MKNLERLMVLSLLFSGNFLFSAEEMTAKAKRGHEHVEPEAVSEESAPKKTRIQKTVRWKEENEEFTIPGRSSGFCVNGQEIDLPIAFERRVFNGELFTEEEVAMLFSDSSDDEEDSSTEIETEEEDCAVNNSTTTTQYVAEPINTAQGAPLQPIILKRHVAPQECTDTAKADCSKKSETK